MPFDPNYPTDGNPFLAEPMRQQLLSLKAMIDALVTLNAAQVDAVNTLNPGEPATAAVTADGSTLRFTFNIPRGSDGAPGPQGPAFGNAIVDTVTTIDPGQPAGVSVSFDGNTVHFGFAIPRGNDGAQGNEGPQGPQGPPGDVTAAQLNSAITGTSNNTNSVATLDSAFGDADMETLRAKLNELILAARR